jgi:hypothetical protein
MHLNAAAGITVFDHHPRGRARIPMNASRRHAGQDQVKMRPERFDTSRRTSRGHEDGQPQWREGILPPALPPPTWARC